MAAGDRLSAAGPEAGAGRPIFTVGHSTRSIDELIQLLQAAAVEQLVDVRAFPRSRTNPQFNIETMPAALMAAGIGYRHAPALGGRRGRQDLGFASPNGAWRNDSFHNFADYALTPAFRPALGELLALSRARTCAILCAESAWQRCHRRIIADWLVAAGAEVRHILDAERIAGAQLDAAAVVQPDGAVHYPPAQGALL